jgi:glycosyltransferase involved in cell wall biosynthesis
MPQATLQVTLDCEIPRQVTVGSGTALFVCGWCFLREGSIDTLELVLDGEAQPVMASSMPRLDPFRELHPGLDAFATAGLTHDPDSESDPGLHSYRSGFWGMVRITGPRAPGPLRLELRARMRDGSEAVAALAQVDVVVDEQPAVVGSGVPARAGSRDAAGAPAVAICMATYNPAADLLRRQLDSIRAQSHENWVCLISDDCSSAPGRATLEAAIDGDRRFVVSRSPRRLGFYRNFERALTMVPDGAELVALSDQDDIWRPDKLATLVAAIGDAQLVYSDARVVSRTGEVISETWWSRRRNNHSDLLSLLVANSVTGAASLMRRELLDDALPFPPAQFAHFHDHWLGLAALALGDIRFLAEPLFDYVQHDDASLGHAAANQMSSLRERLAHRRGLRERVALWRMHYFVDLCRLTQFATVLQLRCDTRMTRRKRRELRRFLRAERSPAALVRFALRGARELTGTPETLGAEWMLLHALVWRRLLGVSARDRPQRRLRLDALPQSKLVAPPGRVGIEASAGALADKVAPLRWMLSEDAPRRVNILIPTLDMRHLFAGYIGKFNLARRLAELGERVRLVTTDPVGVLPPDYRRTLESYSGLAGLMDRVELVFGRESPGIEISPHDGFVATTWWTAHVAHHAMTLVDGERFAYLIQEYEPFTFPMGSYAALAAESYRFDHVALFSSELLRDYFRRHAIGVYADGVGAGDRASEAFQNAITVVPAPTVSALARPGPRRLLFYARPEPHATRNMFELGVLALSRAVAEGVFQDGWELRGIGTVRGGRRIPLGAGAALTLVPRSDQGAYAGLLGEHDVGLALMYTPHPSLVPIEMASAGMLTVTNSFENKTAAAMAAISSNLICVEPSVDALVAGLRDAVSTSGDLDRRVLGSRVEWSTDWDVSLSDGLLRRLLTALEPNRLLSRGTGLGAA